ncbi:MAG: right-handed parallel beta-helix repeat-containing protein [Actinomycetes bacterium]
MPHAGVLGFVTVSLAAGMVAASLAGVAASPALAADCVKNQGTDFTDQASLQSLLAAGCAGGGTMTVNFNTGTFPLAGGLTWGRTEPLVLHGQGAGATTLSGNNTATILTANAGTAAVEVSGISITGGNSGGGGGGVRVGNGTLTVTNSTISGNTATGASAAGGGVYVFGTLTVTNSTISNNTAPDGPGGGVYTVGTVTVTGSTISGNTGKGIGGISSTGAVTVTNSTINNNTATTGSAGGVFASGAVTVTGSTISGNTATGSGGGGVFSTAPVTVTNSTISNNSATAGAGVYANSTVTVTNSTISGNTATVTVGGGLFPGGALTVTNSTISGNTAATGGGGIYAVSTTVLKFATIVNNSAPSGANIRGSGAPNNFTSVGSVIANSSSNSCGNVTPGPVAPTYNATRTGDASCGFVDPSNSVASLAQMSLGPLAVNGNPSGTQTMLPSAGSVLIGVVPTSIGQAAIGPNGTDQRGVTRVGPFWMGAAQQLLGPLAFSSGVFAAATIGTPSNLTVTVTNAGIDAAMPSAVTPTGAGVTVTGGTCAVATPIAAGGTCTVGLAWTPAVAGALVGGSLTIAYSGGANPSDALALGGTAAPRPIAQTPAGSCITPGGTKSIPRFGTKRLAKPACKTNAGQTVGVSVAAAPRSGVRVYSLYCKKTNGTTSATSATKYRNGSRYCKRGELRIRTYGKHLRIRVVWSAPARGDFTPYRMTRNYRT